MSHCASAAWKPQVFHQDWIENLMQAWADNLWPSPPCSCWRDQDFTAAAPSIHLCSTPKVSLPLCIDFFFPIELVEEMPLSVSKANSCFYSPHPNPFRPAPVPSSVLFWNTTLCCGGYHLAYNRAWLTSSTNTYTNSQHLTSSSSCYCPLTNFSSSSKLVTESLDSPWNL
jgi:hypothetical protein